MKQALQNLEEDALLYVQNDFNKIAEEANPCGSTQICHTLIRSERLRYAGHADQFIPQRSEDSTALRFGAS